MTRRRIGVMGGTFDPIHHGHLVAASEVQHWFDLDEVVFVPTGDPWQKAGRDVTPAEHRYLMTVIATASNPRFTDGGEFGFGAEIGISTQKLHARGPMGLPEMTSTKYVVTGDGHVR